MPGRSMPLHLRTLPNDALRTPKDHPSLPAALLYCLPPPLCPSPSHALPPCRPPAAFSMLFFFCNAVFVLSFSCSSAPLSVFILGFHTIPDAFFRPLQAASPRLCFAEKHAARPTRPHHVPPPRASAARTTLLCTRRRISKGREGQDVGKRDPRCPTRQKGTSGVSALWPVASFEPATRALALVSAHAGAYRACKCDRGHRPRCPRMAEAGGKLRRICSGCCKSKRRESIEKVSDQHSVYCIANADSGETAIATPPATAG